RRGMVTLAEKYHVPCFAVAFDTPPDVCKARNRQRSRKVPSDVIAAQLRSWVAVKEMLAAEGFAAVHQPDDVRLVPPAFARAPDFANRQKEQPVSLEFGLQIPRFTWPGG